MNLPADKEKDTPTLDMVSDAIKSFIKDNYIPKSVVREQIENGVVELTPIKESMQAGMSLSEAENVHCFADGYNNALKDLKNRLFND